jgi:hypothetical protein
MIVERTGSFFLALVAAGVLVVGAAVCLVLVQRVEGIRWEIRKSEMG